MKLYYHKTDGGAEYLSSKFVLCPDGSKEGVFDGASYIVRLDGEPELMLGNTEPIAAVLLEALRAAARVLDSIERNQSAIDALLRKADPVAAGCNQLDQWRAGLQHARAAIELAEWK